MLQAIVKKGIVLKEKVSAPVVTKGNILIKVVNSCISIGTEVSGVEASGKSLVKRALNQPKKIKKALDIVRKDGFSKLFKEIDKEINIGQRSGYSLSGIVIDIGEGVKGYEVGDRVAAAGGTANHAEIVIVPSNLVVKIDENIDFKSASTVALGSIALQGVRRADFRLGELCTVIGAGFIGLLTIQMLRESGIRVSVIDIDNNRLTIAKKLGAELVINPTEDCSVNVINNWSGGFGVDGVIFTAATSSDEPLSNAFQMCRRKGKVVLVGVSGMTINRKDIYPKEIDFLISTSYGPGRYDKQYEDKGIDYPYAYVRWTENRNMQEYLRMLSDNSIKLDQFLNKTYSIDDVSDAFNSLQTTYKPIAVLLEYGNYNSGNYRLQERKIKLNHRKSNKEVINVAIIGIGSFAQNIHLPNMLKLNKYYNIYAIISNDGYKAKTIAQKYKANYFTTNYNDVLQDENVDLILICTRHGNHTDLVIQALNSGKNVFVEKPLATTVEELNRIKDFYKDRDNSKPLFMVGFNRRFSPISVEIKKHVSKRISPLLINYRMNAGFIPADHWTHENGGRIVGEACHIIDLFTFLIGCRVKSISFESLSPKNSKFQSSDNKSIILKYEDGSVANLQYFSIGSKELSKEYMEVHFDGKSIIMDDYKSLKAKGLKIKEINESVSQKGHLEELKNFANALTISNKWPIEMWDMIQTTEITLNEIYK